MYYLMNLRYLEVTEIDASFFVPQTSIKCTEGCHTHSLLIVTYVKMGYEAVH